MRSLDNSLRADAQIWGTHYLHAMNISDEVVTGQERLGGPKADVGGVSTSMYKLRPLATIGETGALAVPADLLDSARELNIYQGEISINRLPNSHIIPVYGIQQYGYSGAIAKTAHSTKSYLDKLGINRINGFIESETLQNARNELGFTNDLLVPYETVNYINNKGAFLGEMHRIGVPTAYGKTVFSEQDLWSAFHEIRKIGAKQIYVKLARAASGQGVFCIDSTKECQLQEFLELPQAKEQLRSLGIRIDYGIEGIIDSPNMMMYVGEKTQDDRFISASSQLLVKRNPEDERATVHKGNISGLNSSILKKLTEYSQDVANWMRSKGAYGIVGLDYVITNDNKVFIMEANYRVNGGLAAAMKGHDLQSPFWAANGGVKVPQSTTLNEYVTHLQKNGIEYNKGTNSGVIILNPATSPAGTMQVAILGKTRNHIFEIMSGIDMI